MLKDPDRFEVDLTTQFTGRTQEGMPFEPNETKATFESTERGQQEATEWLNDKLGRSHTQTDREEAAAQMIAAIQDPTTDISLRGSRPEEIGWNTGATQLITGSVTRRIDESV